MSSSDRRSVLTALAGLTLAGCGFELRRPPTMQFSTIALAGFAPRSSMAEALRKGLQGVRIVERPAEAEVVLQAEADERGRAVEAQTAAAQVREFQLHVRLVFQAHTPAGRELIPSTELRLTRDLTYNETAALAKQQEEDELYREMQSDIVAQVLRRLASIKV